MNDLLLLCYHAVSAHWPASLAVTPLRFAEQVAWLQRRGYEGITFHAAATGALPERAVAITFDDACRSVIQRALPVLSDAQFPATVFAPTEFVGSDEPMSWPGIEQWLDGEHRDELIAMDWEELGRLARAGWEIGSHTRSHPRLTDLDSAALDAELREPRELIERRLGEPCRSLAYPFGVYDKRIVEAARNAGYTAAAGTLPGRLRPPGDPLEWWRIVVNRSDGGRRFRVKVSPLTRRAKSSPAWDLVAVARRAARLAQRRSAI